MLMLYFFYFYLLDEVVDPLFRPMIPEGGPVKGLQFCREFLFTDGDVGCVGNRSAGALDDILYCLVIYRG